MSEGLTPRQRLLALGYEIDEDGVTPEVGHDGRTGKRRRNPEGDLDPRFHGPTVQPPTLELRCSVGRRGSKVCTELLASLWSHETDLWVAVPLFGHVLEDRLDVLARSSDRSIAVRCSTHGVARISVDALRLAARHSAGRFLLIDVTAGSWGYDVT